MNYKYDDRSFKGIEKMSFQLHCPARQLQRIMNEFELLSIGLINDMYAESRNDDCKYAELATQEDFDRF